MTFTERIEIRPDVMLGKPVIRGTRIPVDLIVRKLEEGASEADLLDAYPRLEREDLRAALLYAAAILAHQETTFLGVGQGENGGLAPTYAGPLRSRVGASPPSGQ